MPAFIVPNRAQMLLMTQVRLEDYAPEGSAVRIINDMVDLLDTSGIESAYDVQWEGGRSPFHPKTMLKVALLAMHTCRFSLRKMEADTRDNLPYQWLTGAMKIDHSTMGYFLARFCKEIVGLFTQVVKICQERGLLEFDLLAIDSLKLRANANYKQSKTIEGIEKEEEKLQLRLEELLARAGDERRATEEEEEALRQRQEKLEEARRELEERLAAKGKELSEQKGEELRKREKINLTDFDARIMELANGERNPAYSVTTGTEAGSDIVVHYQVNEGDNDPGALEGAIGGARENSGERHDEIAADAGFASMGNYERLEAEGQEALIPDRRLEAEQRQECAKGEYDRSRFEYREKEDCYICPEGAVLPKVGRLVVNFRSCDRYENREACARCANRGRCTKASYRIVTRDCNEGVRERMREKLGKKRGRARYNKRAHTAESPYGQVKGNLKYRQVMRRGREKVRMEVGLLFMLHNILKLAPVRSG
jgi:transposase